MSIELLSNITAIVFIVGITAWWLIGANFQDKKYEKLRNEQKS